MLKNIRGCFFLDHSQQCQWWLYADYVRSISTSTCQRQWRCRPFKFKHLLFLMLVMKHLSTLSELTITETRDRLGHHWLCSGAVGRVVHVRRCCLAPPVHTSHTHIAYVSSRDQLNSSTKMRNFIHGGFLETRQTSRKIHGEIFLYRQQSRVLPVIETTELTIKSP